MARDLDIIVFGATGFTGKHCISLLIKFGKTRNLKWGIAGRTEGKLKSLLSECEAKSGTSLSQIPTIIANVSDEKSLKAMARQASVIINCCGPYQFLGEAVVKACVEEGTHHIDVSAEPQYMESMQLKYHERAKEKGVYIISACGVDCIPTDLGLVFLEQKFNGTLNSAETYLDAWEEGTSSSGPAFNSGTLESAIYVLAHARQLKGIRKQLFPRPLPEFKPKLPFKLYPHKSGVVKGWVLPFLGSDRSVLRRSQRYFYENDSKRPVQVQTYFIVKSFLYILLMGLVGGILSLFSRFAFGRKLLLTYPSLFTFGLFSLEPPNEERIENIHFSVTVHGRGWSETFKDPNHEYNIDPNKSMSVVVKGRNPAYGATCVCLILAAATIIKEKDKMPFTGGVYPPGYAFAGTSLIEQLNQNEVTFEVLQEKKVK